MKTEDLRVGKHYRLDGGAKVEILKTGVRGFSGRLDSVRVKYLDGRRAGEEGKVMTREVSHEWNEKDEARAQQRRATIKKVNAARVRLASLGLNGDEARVNARGDGTIGLSFHGATAEQVLDLLDRALEVSRT